MSDGNSAGAAAQTAEKQHRSFWTHLYDAPFKVDWVKAGDVNTRYIEAGDPSRPTIIMLHGIAGSFENFIANIGPMSKGFHVLAMDFVGTGMSDKPDKPLNISDYVDQVADFMDAKGVKTAGIIGLSLGSWVAMAFYAKHPQRVSKIIMISPAGMLTRPEHSAAIRERRMAAVNDPSWARMKVVFDSLIYADEDKIDDVLAMRQNIYRLPEMKRSMENIMQLQDPATHGRNLVPEAVWRTISIPTLFIECPDSPDLSFDVVQKAKEMVPNIQVLTVPKAKHWPQFEHPELFNDAASAFFRA